MELSWGKEYLVDQDWTMVSSLKKYHTHNPNAIANDTIQIVNTWNDLPACMQDDVFHFSSNQIFHHLLGPNNCGGPTDNRTSTWEITLNGKLKISHFRPDGSLNYEFLYQLNHFDETSFDLYVPSTNNAGIKVVTVIGYEKP